METRASAARSWSNSLRAGVIASLTFATLLCGGCGPGQPPAQEAVSKKPKEGTNTPNPANDKAKATPPVAAPTAPTKLARDDSGAGLYARHCAACHGEKGDGRGLAASVLFPKPRDFRVGRFRLVSTKNGVPTIKDFQDVINRGMPGSAMPPWAHLGDEQVMALANEVMRLRKVGLREVLVQRLKDDDEEIDEDELDEQVASLTTPTEPSEVPDIGNPTDEAIARGREAYIKQSCHSCHGTEGKGDGQQAMVDSEGLPTKPRNFLGGIFKGSPDAISLYRRIQIGMPGSPMPASVGLPPEQIVDMVHFIRSLSDEATREATVLKREKIVALRVGALPAAIDAPSWKKVPLTTIRTMPTWWRDDPQPALTAQALHDGKTLAVRLEWQDPAADLNSARTESFKDAAAVELYSGNAEPFFGMGGIQAPVELWVWDAHHQTGSDAVEKQYPNTVVDIYPFHEKVAETAEFSRPGARLSNQPDVSLPARAVGNPIAAVTATHGGGSSLEAAGAGSTTYHPQKSQLVIAVGENQDGRWTVVMKRTLIVPSGSAGISLEPGTSASIAFALWDGSRRDRNGQKLVSIWQDLKIEK